jgi:hypothetical protein
MAQQHAMPTASAARPELCPDRVERRIMRAYVQLAAAPDHADGTRAVTLFRLGSLACRAEKWTRFSALDDAPAKSWSIGLSPKVDSTFGSDALEVRLTETAQNMVMGLPPIWLELRSPLSGAILDSLGCYDFDEDELAAAVEFVLEAAQRVRPLH